MIISSAYFLILIALSTGKELNLEIRNETAADNATSTNSSEILIDTNIPNYLVRISAVIDDLQVPEYLTNIIINRSSTYNIRSDDVLSLWGLKTVNISDFERILSSLNISSSSVFSLNAFESFLTELQLNFNEIYSNIVKEMAIDPSVQLTFLESIGVNSFSFSFALQFSDSFVEFKKGNFSKDLFVTALKTINITSGQLFESCRNQIINGILRKSPEDNFLILQKYGIDAKKISMLGKTLVVDASRPNQIPVFENLLRKVLWEIDHASPLAILVRYNQVIINKRISDMFLDKPIKIVAQDLDYNNTWPVLNTQNSTMPDIMLLSLEKTHSPSDPKRYATLASTKNSLENCIFFSVDNNRTKIFEIVSSVENTGGLLKFNSSLFSSDVSMGSPLVCANKVYGLAEEVSAGVVTLKAFIVEGILESDNINVGNEYVPSASKIILGNCLIVFILPLLRYLFV